MRGGPPWGSGVRAGRCWVPGKIRTTHDKRLTTHGGRDAVGPPGGQGCVEGGEIASRMFVV